jgi:hypothetical protein
VESGKSLIGFLRCLFPPLALSPRNQSMVAEFMPKSDEPNAAEQARAFLGGCAMIADSLDLLTGKLVEALSKGNDE